MTGSNDVRLGGHDDVSRIHISQTRREEVPCVRDARACARDSLAAQRDQVAIARDQEDRDLDERCGDRSVEVREVLARAAAARARASEDRRHAALDRASCSDDRVQAAMERGVAGTDELTGARRRGIGLEELEREIDRTRRTRGGLVAVFVDVDGLKLVNDRLGHAEGDRLLRQVVHGLQREMRSYDLIVRVGGDEFVCALVDVTPANARERCELVKAELRLAGAASSFSVGIGELMDTDGVSDLIARADRDLLRRRQGRI